MLLWRVCRNVVPVRNLLKRKGVNTTILCPLCGVDVEHLRHIFIDCCYAQACWHELRVVIDRSVIFTCPDWLLQVLSSESYDRLGQIATIIYGIWSARNLRVWENKIVSVQQAMQWSCTQVKQWRDCQQKRCSQGRASAQQSENKDINWKPPSEGRMKINVDAHVVAGCNWFSCGLVLRDHRGQFIRARTHKLAGSVPVVEEEARGVLAAIKWINSLGLDSVDIESDSLCTVRAVNGVVDNLLEVGAVFQQCQNWLENRRDSLVVFVKKQANMVAHLIARAPCDADCFIDMLVPPQSVLEHLVRESYLN